MSESNKYTCEVCGGSHPTEEHGSFEQEKQSTTEVGTSGYRIEKLRVAATGLSSQFENYFNLEGSPYSKTKASDIEKVGKEVDTRFYEIKQLLPRMEDFPLSDQEKDIIIDLIDKVEILEKQWYKLKSKYPETRDRAPKTEEFKTAADLKLQKIISGLGQLPVDRRSPLKFESGHNTQLLEALNQDDIVASRDIILEIDKLLCDGYSSYSKRIAGGADLRFRLEQALQEPDNPKLVNTKMIELTKGSLVIRTSQDKVSVSIGGLDTDQQRIWETIK